MNNRRLLRAPLLLALPLAFIIGACSEDLESGGACPALCPGQQLEIVDTLLDPAVEFDTTVSGMPLRGFEPTLLLARRQDTLDVRAIIRFDTIIRGFKPTGVDTVEAVTMVDSATLDIRIRRTPLPLPETFFIDAYDVADSTVPDSMPETLIPLFAPERLLGTLRIDSAGFQDTALVRIPIDTAQLLDVIEDPTRVMRIGLRIRALGSVELRVLPVDSGNLGPKLRYRVTPDTQVSVANIVPSSSTPTTPLFQSFDFIDYSLVVLAPRILAADRFTVGGLPGNRSYLRFDLPRWLTDSSTVLRARLELVQAPIRGLDDTVTFAVRGQMAIAGHAVTDLRRAVNLLAPLNAFIRDSIILTPGDSGRREIEINGLITQWRTLDGVRVLPNALVLRSSTEGQSALAARFFGVNAAPDLRPRLRISYVPSSSFTFGQP
jgi:hypothetical protein